MWSAINSVRSHTFVFLKLSSLPPLWSLRSRCWSRLICSFRPNDTHGCRVDTYLFYEHFYDSWCQQKMVAKWKEKVMVCPKIIDSFRSFIWNCFRCRRRSNERTMAGTVFLWKSHRNLIFKVNNTDSGTPCIIFYGQIDLDLSYYTTVTEGEVCLESSLFLSVYLERRTFYSTSDEYCKSSEEFLQRNDCLWFWICVNTDYASGFWPRRIEESDDETVFRCQDGACFSSFPQMNVSKLMEMNGLSFKWMSPLITPLTLINSPILQVLIFLFYQENSPF